MNSRTIKRSGARLKMESKTGKSDPLSGRVKLARFARVRLLRYSYTTLN